MIVKPKNIAQYVNKKRKTLLGGTVQNKDDRTGAFIE
jgi:hypothetical protein